jgi:hypothetical protein
MSTKPVAVMDERGVPFKTVARFNTIAEAEACIVGLHWMDKASVEAGLFGIDAPESMINPPCPNCQDRPGKDGLWRTCKTCGGKGYVKPKESSRG